MPKKEERQVEHIEERSTPRTPVIYEIVRRVGEEEMERPATSLWWSGLAAGLSMSFSLLAMALLQMHLPESDWRPLLRALGYPVGFLMTYLIGIADAAHIVAGSVESFLLLANGELGVSAMLGGFTVPVLIGNIVGGTALFALLSYAQVMKEL